MRFTNRILALAVVAALLTAGGASAAPGGTVVLNQTTDDVGASTWTLTERTDGTFVAVETGLGGAVGTARFVGQGACKELVIDWTTQGGYAGSYRWALNAQETAGQGKMTWTVVPPPQSPGAFHSVLTSLTRMP